jgi:cytochrome d ubiquinol oxidase subunit II
MHQTNRDERDAILQSTAASRYSSEWWLIAATVVMFFAFPYPFRMLAQGLAAPIGVMLAALSVRIVAAGFRKSGNEHFWSATFAAASVVVALAQGFCLGGFLGGVSVAGGRFVGGWFHWATPFSTLVAVALTIGYTLMGAAWLTFQTAGALGESARRNTIAFSLAATAAMAAISIATLLVHPTVSARWGVSFDGIDWAYFLPLSPLPIAAAGGLACAFISARRGNSGWAFFGSAVAMAAGYGGLAISIWPYIVPYGFTAAQSAADIQELRQVLMWTVAGAPMLIVFSILAYDAWRVHVGKPGLLPLRLQLRF